MDKLNFYELLVIELLRIQSEDSGVHWTHSTKQTHGCCKVRYSGILFGKASFISPSSVWWFCDCIKSCTIMQIFITRLYVSICCRMFALTTAVIFDIKSLSRGSNNSTSSLKNNDNTVKLHDTPVGMVQLYHALQLFCILCDS